MKKFTPFILLAVLLAPALPAQDIFQKIESKSRYELADAYWQVAAKFEALGQKARADVFRKEAKAIFPGYPEKPQLVQDTTQTTGPQGTPGTVDPLTGIATRPAVREQNINAEKIVRYQFSKLLRGAVTGNPALVKSVLGSPLTIQGENLTGIETEISVLIDQWFAGLNTTELSPSSLFELETLEVSGVEGKADTWKVTVEARTEDLPEDILSLTFWKPKQEYRFTRGEGDLWKLVEIQTSE